MKAVSIHCPNCGKNVEFDRDSPIGFCPYCSQQLYLDDEGMHITYTEIDKARITESNNDKEIKMKHMQMEENAGRIKTAFESMQFKVKAAGVIAAGIAIFILIIIAVMHSYAKKQYASAYQDIMAQMAESESLQVNKKVTVDVALLQKMVEPASDLVTYKYYYTAAGVYEKNQKIGGIVVPFTTDKTVFLYDGKIGAGISIEEVSFEVDNDKKTINVYAPQPRVLTNELDTESFRVFDVKNSMFTSSSLEDYGEFEEALKEEQESKLEDNEEFWARTRGQVKNVLQGLLNASGTLDEYEITFTFR